MGSELIFLRSLLYNFAFYISITLQMIFWTPVFFILPRSDGWKVVKFWALSCLWLQNKIVGTRFEFRGTENIPPSAGLIVAAKHQSTWETFTILPFLDDPSYILKRELMFIPLFGWFAAKMKVVPVNRGKRGIALASMTVHAKRQYQDGRQIIIYPEGTRKAPYAPPTYKYGITHLYTEINPRVLPVALNSGLFWRRNSFMRYPGTIIMEFLPLIEPGLKKDAFSRTLEETIETHTAKLLAEAENDPEFKKALKS